MQNVPDGCGRAELFNAAVTCAGVSDGLTASIRDTTPDTIGAAKLVPCELLIVYAPSDVVPLFVSVRINDTGVVQAPFSTFELPQPPPGALMVTFAPTLA